MIIQNATKIVIDLKELSLSQLFSNQLDWLTVSLTTTTATKTNQAFVHLCAKEDGHKELINAVFLS